MARLRETQLKAIELSHFCIFLPNTCCQTPDSVSSLFAVNSDVSASQQQMALRCHLSNSLYLAQKICRIGHWAFKHLNIPPKWMGVWTVTDLYEHRGPDLLRSQTQSAELRAHANRWQYITAGAIMAGYLEEVFACVTFFSSNLS